MKKVNSIFPLFKDEFSKISSFQKRICKMQKSLEEKQKDLRKKLANEILARISDEATLTFLSCIFKDEGVEKLLIEILIDRCADCYEFRRNYYTIPYRLYSSKIINICKNYGINDPNKFLKDLKINCPDVKFLYFFKTSNTRIYLKIEFN